MRIHNQIVLKIKEIVNKQFQVKSYISSSSTTEASSNFIKPVHLLIISSSSGVLFFITNSLYKSSPLLNNKTMTSE